MNKIELIKFVIQVSITVGAAFLAAWLASKRFRSERWWERKAEAYANLLDALHMMKWPSSEHFEAEIERRKVNHEYSEQLWQEFNDARRKVWRIADSASFLVSSEVLEAVHDMERGLSDANSANTYFEHLDEQYGAVDKCIERVKDIGAKELKVGGT